MSRGIRRLSPARAQKRRQRDPEGPLELRELFESLPEDLRLRALTHSSWSAHRADSYGRLAFLGDSVLGLAVAEYLFRRHPRSDIGRLTKVHGQVVSGRACAQVAAALDIPERLAGVAPRDLEGGISLQALLGSERALASLCEAVIGACYLEYGFERAAAATVAAFAPQVAIASERLLDFKSALQEQLARRGEKVRYEITAEAGPPHDRRFEVAALVGEEVIGSGSGRSKKAAEQEAAARSLERLEA